MTDIDHAAERVRRSRDHREPLEIIYGTDDFESAEWGYSNDIDALAAAYLTQQPSYAAQSAEIESAWKMIESEFDIEPRAQIEAEAKTNGFKHGLAQAIHTIWKRDAKVTELAAEIAELRAAISLQKQVAGEAIDAYARVSDQLAELRAKLDAAEKERDHDRLFTRTVLASLHWTGDGYEWTGGRFDYRMQPSEAAALTTSEIERLRAEAKEHKSERNMLMTALDGLLNDFIKAVPSSEPIDCHKFTRYQPALLAYVTVRDRRPLDQHNPRETIKEIEAGDE